MNERTRGIKEAQLAIPKLQERWPAAFPIKRHLVKPLTSTAIAEISAAMEWSRYYTRGVLQVWKMRDGYCRSILQHDRRYDLGGTITDEVVADAAREQARSVLERRAIKKREESKADNTSQGEAGRSKAK